MPTTPHPPGDRANGCDKCGEPHPRCRAHNAKGKPCGGKIVTGLNVCRTHGGSAPQVKAKAARVVEEAKASRELARLGQKVTVHPAEALLDLVHWTAGEVAYWRQVVTEVAEHNDGKDLLWGTTKTKEGGDDRGTTKEAKPHIAYTLLERASDRLAQYATAALKAGVDERRVRLAERQGDLIATMQRAILDRMFAAVLELLRAHGVDDEKIIAALQQGWAESMGVVVPEELRRLIEGTDQ